MCDTEAYIYLPLLEETGYIPKHKYSYGSEIREYANLIAEKWDLTDKAMFRTEIKTADWDESGKRWAVTMVETRGPSEESKQNPIAIHAQFILVAAGVLNFPQVPKLPGLDKFQGHHFHTSRWDYGYTGGEPGGKNTQNPALEKLKDKRVALLGTGATAVQAVPHLAKWSKELIVFQRTPSAVDSRDQRATDVTKWKEEVAFKKGWQSERMVRFDSYIGGAPSGEDLVMDGWTDLKTYHVLIGGPSRDEVSNFHTIDVERMNRVRARVDELVKDKTTADKLKAWYPSLVLVDTDGKGVERITERGLVVNGQEYPIDLLILSTGYRGPASGNGSPGDRANVVVKGRNGKAMNEKWDGSIATLHGVVSHDFPNFFFPGPYQSSATANYTHLLDQMARHVAYIIAEGARMAKNSTNFDKFSVEPSVEAEEDWTRQILSGAGNFAGIVGCTPSYINREGEINKPKPVEKQMKAARGSVWALGMGSFVETIESWRDKGGMEGIEVKV
ncbi:FAD/NAD(P)-binding domain-containing protein [Gymnopus androsaceus JB14]|uniref:FAD/NAD(P)-binding domain-containing protein n=1 Tax=Gymnopus androsaceus JB14 TaxID=1447944 RepID=A0A6A4H5A2_9AGAR|nr:FAD/NAD(P)-binding domain-containing protein [Gymnopus androsaceus JB14]